jgi:ribonuclease P protein component
MVEGRFLQEDAQRADGYYRPNLPKKEIITDPSIIRSVYNNKMRIRIKKGLIDAVAAPHEKWGLAILIKKSAGTAVFRNRIKRVIRAVFRSLKANSKKPYIIVFSSRKTSSGENIIPSYQQLFSTIYTAIKNV